MKSYLILAFTAMTLFACTTEELETVDENLNIPPGETSELIDGEVFKNNRNFNINPIQFPNPLNEIEPNQPGSLENPIPVDDTDFIEGVTYSIRDCNRDITYNARYSFGRLTFTVSTGTSTSQRTLSIQPGGCGIVNPVGNSTVEGPIFESGLYYTVRGELLRLSGAPTNPFFSRNFFRVEPGSDQVRFANIFPAEVNSEITFGDLTANPIPDILFSCRGVQPLRAGGRIISTNPGEYYVSRSFNSLVQFDGEARIFRTINACGLEPEDNCTGVDNWVSGTRYSVGDQVVFQNVLFTRTATSWINEGECGS